jgi:hypothetical protein
VKFSTSEPELKSNNNFDVCLCFVYLFISLKGNISLREKFILPQNPLYSQDSTVLLLQNPLYSQGSPVLLLQNPQFSQDSTVQCSYFKIHLSGLYCALTLKATTLAGPSGRCKMTGCTSTGKYTFTTKLPIR